MIFSLSFYVFTFVLFCFENVFIYRYVTTRYTLNKKQKGSLLGLKTSFILTIVGVYTMVNFYRANLNFIRYVTSMTMLDLYLQEMSIIYLFSYIVCDTCIGFIHYHSLMRTMSGYPHHLLFITILIPCIYTENDHMIVSGFIAELSTFVINLGTIHKKYRSDLVFGITMFFTRIVHVGFIVWSIRVYAYQLPFGLLLFSLYTFWFYKWVAHYITKYTKVHQNIDDTEKV